jgi:hypothetical protein
MHCEAVEYRIVPLRQYAVQKLGKEGGEALLVAASLSVNIDLHTLRAKLLYLGDAYLIYQTIRYRPLLSIHR